MICPCSVVHSREFLDLQLSRALNVPLTNGRLAPIDESNYVLTLDYTLKMLNINERYECGIPVIIEGETGVGKTALVEMLSKLWNYAWLNEWNRYMDDILEHIRRNMGGKCRLLILTKDPCYEIPNAYPTELPLDKDNNLYKCVRAIQNFTAGDVIREESLNVIVRLPDASVPNDDQGYPCTEIMSSLKSTVLSPTSGRQQFGTSYSSAHFTNPDLPLSGFQSILWKKTLALQGNPLFHMLKFPPLKTKTSLDDLFRAVTKDERDLKVTLITSLITPFNGYFSTIWRYTAFIYITSLQLCSSNHLKVLSNSYSAVARDL